MRPATLSLALLLSSLLPTLAFAQAETPEKKETATPERIAPAKPPQPASDTLPRQLPDSPAEKAPTEHKTPDPGPTKPTTLPPVAPEPAQARLDTDLAAECPECALWIGTDLLLWNVTRMGRPPLVTTSPVGTPLAQAGVLGQGATVLVGGRDLGELRAGFRLNAGVWLDDQSRWCLEGSFFALEQLTSQSVFVSDGSTILARPIINALNSAEGSKIVAYPGIVAGRVAVDADSTLWGLEANLRHGLWGAENGRLDFLLGYRYLRLTDSIRIRDEEVVLANQLGNLPMGTTSSVVDEFRAKNEFNGVQFGLAGRVFYDCLTFDGFFKLAFGSTYQVVDINGSTRLVLPGQDPVVSTGGLQALSSNSGRHSRDRFAVVPELGCNAGCQINSWLRLSAGYSALFVSDVARSGEHIGRRINPDLLPPPQPTTGPSNPAFNFRSRGVWAQGVNLGAEFRW